LGDEIKNEVGGVCSTYGGEERGNLRGRNDLEKTRPRLGDNIKMDLQDFGYGHGLD
jgi:hypothetical protein